MFVVEMDYKVMATAHHRHKCHQLVEIKGMMTLSFLDYFKDALSLTWVLAVKRKTLRSLPLTEKMLESHNQGFLHVKH